MDADQEKLATLQAILDGFNAHDLDAIMSHFTEDCIFDAPRGPEMSGRRFVGFAEVRAGFAARFEGIPDVHLAVAPAERLPFPDAARTALGCATMSGARAKPRPSGVSARHTGRSSSRRARGSRGTA